MCVGGVRVESEGRMPRDRAGSFKIHARSLSAPGRARTLPGAQGSSSRLEANSRRNLRHPCPSVPTSPGPHLWIQDPVPRRAELGEEESASLQREKEGCGVGRSVVREGGREGGLGGMRL